MLLFGDLTHWPLNSRPFWTKNPTFLFKEPIKNGPAKMGPQKLKAD